MTPQPSIPDERPSDLAELRRLAEAATPGPWRRSGPGPEPDGDQLWITGKRDQFVAWKEVLTTDASGPAIADFDFIAAASPDVVLALLDFIESVAATSNDPHLASLAALKGPAR